MIELLLDPTDASEERKKEKGQQVSLAVRGQISISISCPAVCPAVPYSSTGQVRNCFSTGKFYIKSVPSPRPGMETRSNFLRLVCAGKERAHGIIQLSIHLWICSVIIPWWNAVNSGMEDKELSSGKNSRRSLKYSLSDWNYRFQGGQELEFR